MKVISLINMKGGVGKTTLSTNICHCLSKRNDKKVLLIDIDPQFNATQCLFTGEEYIQHLTENKDTIISVFEERRNIASSVDGLSERKSKELKDISPVCVNNNFYILPGHLELYRIEMAAGTGKENRLKRYIQEIATKINFDFIIIDTPPTPSIWMTSALIASDYYSIPVKPDPISYTGIDLLKTIVDDKKEAFDLKIKCIGLVFTMVEREDSIVYKGALSKIKSGEWKNYKYRKYLPKRTDVAKYQLNKSFILDREDSSLNAALVGIVDELIERIEKDEKK